MEKPELLSLRDLYNEIEAASFTVKMRGYAPEEVDEFMDQIVEKLKAAEEKLKELDRYEQWLREDVHRQVMEKAQEEARKMESSAREDAQQATYQAQTEARQILTRAQEEARQLMQGAQDRSRAMLEAAQTGLAREQTRFTTGIQQYQTDWAEKKRGMEQELSELQQMVVSYRRQATQALETALGALREEGQPAMTQPLPRRAADPARMGDYAPYSAQVSPTATPGSMPQARSSEEIDRMLEELKRQIL